jgi:hypothetical protein
MKIFKTEGTRLLPRSCFCRRNDRFRKNGGGTSGELFLRGNMAHCEGQAYGVGSADEDGGHLEWRLKDDC